MLKTKELYEIYKKFPVITTDTRNLPPHSIFFALKGEKFDGNEFAGKAVESGCEFAVVDNAKYANNKQIILVDNVLKSLQELANYHRKQFNIPIFAITGTNGKTTTKELISSVLAKKFKTHYTKGNLNNHIGVPITLLSMPFDTEIAIIEMGANHPKEIEFLCKIAEPTHGLITNIGKAHIQGFGSFEGVIKTKSELYQHLIKNGGIIFYNSDNEILRKLEKTRKTETYGTKNADILGFEVSAEPFLAIKWTTQPDKTIEPLWSGKDRHIQTQLIGSYNFENVLAAISVGVHFQIDKSLIKQALEEYKSTNNRSQYQKTEANDLILDAYNANPSSMSAALDNFSKIQSDSKMVILGDMLELGEISENEHFNILKKVETANIKNAIFVGEIFFKLCSKSSAYISFKKWTECAEFLIENKPHNKLILIKGSRGIQLEKIIPHL